MSQSLPSQPRGFEKTRASVERLAGGPLLPNAPRHSFAPHRFPRYILCGSVAALLASFAAPTVKALPEGGQVAAGQAAISTNHKAMTITASDRSILNFNKFNIGAEESVRFVQPSSASSVLARATDGTPSEIFGRLEANGRLVLANTAGIYFRNGSVVSVGGLIAAAGHVADADFLRNAGSFAVSLTGEVHNAGEIAALEGNVALLGQNVLNTGSIVAPTGAVVLFSGENLLLSEPDGNITAVRSVSQPNGKADSSSPAPRPSGAGVEQAGKISASSVFLGAADLYAVGVRHTGSSAAKTSIRVQSGGKAVVSGGMQTEVPATGTAKNIDIQADTVELTDATLAAQGTGSGGRIEVRGQEVTLDRNSTIEVSGVHSGNGGSIAIFADGMLRLEGALSARGGESGGNGGKISLNASAPVAGILALPDVSAPAGEPGTLEQNFPVALSDSNGANSLVNLPLENTGISTTVSFTSDSLTSPGTIQTPPGIGDPVGTLPPANTLGGAILILNGNAGTGTSGLTLGGGNTGLSTTGQPNSGTDTTASTLTVNTVTPPANVGTIVSPLPADYLTGVLVLNTNSNTGANTGTSTSGLTLVGGNTTLSSTGQPTTGTVLVNPTLTPIVTNPNNLTKPTDGVLTITTPPLSSYTNTTVIDVNHGKIETVGGVNFSTGNGFTTSGVLILRGPVLSQATQTVVAGAMQFNSPATDSVTRTRAPQTLSEFTALYPVPTRFAGGAGPQIAPGISFSATSPQNGGSALNAPFAADAFSAVSFETPAKLTPEKTAPESNNRE